MKMTFKLNHTRSSGRLVTLLQPGQVENQEGGGRDLAEGLISTKAWCLLAEYLYSIAL